MKLSLCQSQINEIVNTFAIALYPESLLSDRRHQQKLKGTIIGIANMQTTTPDHVVEQISEGLKGKMHPDDQKAIAEKLGDLF